MLLPRLTLLCCIALFAHAPCNSMDVIPRLVRRVTPLMLAGLVTYRRDIWLAPVATNAYEPTAIAPVRPQECWVKRDEYWIQVAPGSLTAEERAAGIQVISIDGIDVYIIGEAPPTSIKTILSRRADHLEDDNHSSK